MAKVLLVDDELTMVQMVADLLRRESHEVFPFTNGQEAAAAMAANSPELVITDLYLGCGHARSQRRWWGDEADLRQLAALVERIAPSAGLQEGEHG